MGHIIHVAAGNDQGPLLNRVSMAQYTIAVCFVALRFFTRGCIVKRFGLDDLFIALAMSLGLAQTATIILQVENGRGRHSTELHVDEFNRMLMYKWINMLIYFAANWAVKMSILALYYRIGHGRQGLPSIVKGKSVLITAGVISAYSLAVFLAQLFVCMPVSKAWDVESIPGGCFNGQLFMQISGAVNIATDVVLLLFPLPLLRLIKFNKRQRTGLAVILSIGLIPVVASTMRLCEIVMSGSPINDGATWQQADSSWTWAWVPVWSQIEVDVGIVAASLPCLSPLLKFFCGDFTHSRAATPSQVPTIPGYRVSWGEKRLSAASLDSYAELEKGPGVHEEDVRFSYLSEISQSQIGVARTADARVVLNAGLPRIVEYRRM